MSSKITSRVMITSSLAQWLVSSQNDLFQELLRKYKHKNAPYGFELFFVYEQDINSLVEAYLNMFKLWS